MTGLALVPVEAGADEEPVAALELVVTVEKPAFEIPNWVEYWN